MDDLVQPGRMVISFRYIGRFYLLKNQRFINVLKKTFDQMFILAVWKYCALLHLYNSIFFCIVIAQRGTFPRQSQKKNPQKNIISIIFVEVDTIKCLEFNLEKKSQRFYFKAISPRLLGSGLNPQRTYFVTKGFLYLRFFSCRSQAIICLMRSIEKRRRERETVFRRKRGGAGGGEML